jgi:hypothetical protein
MTFFWGAVGYVLAGFAPGYLIVRVFRIERLLPPIAGPFALSLIVNCIIVETAVFFGAYTTAAARVVGSGTVLICLLALLSDRRLAFESMADRLNSTWLLFSGAAKTIGGRHRKILLLLCCMPALIVILLTLYLLASSFGSILTGYDPVAQWNLWAVDWAADRLPNRIYHYPQLVPILWSIPYVLMGNSAIEFFSASFKFVFWLLTFETLVFAAIRCRDPVVLLSIPITFILIRWGVGGTSVQDSIDVPVAFFSLLSVTTILFSPDKQRQAVALALVLASGAAMTKQVGLYMIGAIPLVCLCWTYEDHKQFAAVLRVIPDLVWKASLAVVLCAPIYIYAILTIRNGTNTSELGYLFDGIYENRGRVSRAVDAIQFAHAWLGPGGTAAVLIAFSAFTAANIAVVRDSRYRWILLGINIPFSCLWALYFSYDRRNLALTMPLWALTSAVGTRVMLEKYLKLLPRSFADHDFSQQHASRMMGESFVGRYGPAALIVTVTFALVLAANNHFTEGRMLARQDQIELQILAKEDPVPAAPMLALMNELGPSLRIFSEWRWACAFHFNRNSGKCSRIFPDDFFRDPPASLIGKTQNPVLLILLDSSINSDRERWLADAGFVEKPTAADSAGARYFVRHSSG